MHEKGDTSDVARPQTLHGARVGPHRCLFLHAGKVSLLYTIDPENEHLIQEAISKLTQGKTIITIAHRLPTIEQADQILVVDDGRIVQCGKHSQLASVPGKYRDFVEVRQRAESWSMP